MGMGEDDAARGQVTHLPNVPYIAPRKELPSAADPVAYSLGFVLATGLLHVSGICLGLLNALHRGIVVTRSMGALIAVLGVWVLYRAIGT